MSGKLPTEARHRPPSPPSRASLGCLSRPRRFLCRFNGDPLQDETQCLGGNLSAGCSTELDMFPTSSTVEDAPSRRSKRPRIKEACTSCRERNTRCDGQRPICQACLHRGVGDTCRWDFPMKRNRKDTLHHHPAAANVEALPNRYPSGEDSIYPSGAAPPSGLPTPAETAPNVSSPQAPYLARSDGTGVLVEGFGESVYGPSSTITFLRHVVASLTGPKTSTEPQKAGHACREPGTNASRGTTSSISSSQANPAIAGLTRREADDFLRCYWEQIHPLFPVLYRPDFTHHYESHWSVDGTSTPDEPYFAGALDLVFAIGCKLSSATPQPQRHALVNQLYERSRRHALKDFLDGTSLPLLQNLLLEVIFLQSTKYSTRCMNTLCLAIRNAQALGLHLTCERQPPQGQVDYEVRLRLWHTCLTLDR